MLRSALSLGIALAFFFHLNAQDYSKKRMDASVFEEWKSISAVQISNDGQWVTYNLSTEEKDKKLHLINTKTLAQKSFPRAENAKITYDNAHLIYTSSPPIDSIKAMRRKKMKDDELPGDTLCIYDLRTSNLEKIPDFSNYKIPEKWSGFIFYQLKPKIGEGKGAKVGVDSLTQEITLEWDKENEENGSRLYFKNLNSSRLDSFIYVKDYVLAEESANVLFHSIGDDSTFLNGVYKYDLEIRRLDVLTKDKGEVKNLTLNKSGQKAAFHINRDTNDLQVLPFEMMYAEGAKKAKSIAHHNSRNIPSGWYINEFSKPYFSKDQSALFYGIKPRPILQDTALLEDEIVNVEVWSYKDKMLHTQQKVRKDDFAKKAYMMRYDCQKGASVQLTYPGEGSDLILTKDKNEKTFLITEQSKHLESISWEGFPSYKDIYLVDEFGEKELLEERIRANVNTSPSGKYIYYFSSPDSEWFCINKKTKKKISLSQKISEKVYNELHDTPSFPWPYGIAAWTKDDQQIIIYDRYDLWLVSPNKSSKAEKLTNGRLDKISYRLLRLDPDQTSINPNEDLTLFFYDDATGASGYASLNLKEKELKELIKSDHRYNKPIKAKNADVLIFRKESFKEYPNLETTNSKFENPKMISDANPQQEEYSWGNIEWYRWQAHDGQELRGLLLKPDNFDPNKKYPMLVNFYEKSSEGIHRHRAPYPHRSTINYAYYVNRGYVIFNPDVPYKEGYPGQSAFNAVVSGVESLIKEGFVDEDKIGVQGHSWGGYQVAHLITKTDIFACAESGAPVVNMISAYGGIRWQTGLSRMFQYEHTQSRLGATLWDKPELYIENSPIFELDKVNTPVLIMHNDKDGHVPWYQGIEYFVSMRRLNKPAWMLNYNNEPHWPLKRVNRLDFNLRMEQFFDHYLLDKPMPDWMKNGVSAINKGINQGFELEKN